MTSQDFGNQVTALILTYNEAENIERVLIKLDWVKEIIVIDSGSNDDTLEIVGRNPKTRVLHRDFDTHAAQWNFGLHETGISTDWVLALDADYVLTDELVEEMRALDPPDSIAAYQGRFRYCIQGKPLRGTLYPPAKVLFRKSKANYGQDGHTQRLQLDGTCAELKFCLLHDDRKPLSRWLWAQERYAELEADHLLSTNTNALNMKDRLRRLIVVTPWLVPLYCLIVKRGLLDGWAGIYYAFQRGMAEMTLSLKLIERLRLSKSR